MLHGVALERPIRRAEIEMEAEKKRLGFVENRDGNAGAIAFAMQSRSQYRRAVLTSRKRRFTKPSHASLPEYRRGFIESYLAFKRYIETHNASFATRCTARSS